MGKLKIKPISIAKTARNRFQEEKGGKLLYMTYVLTFPDGDVWIKQRSLVQEMRWEMKEALKEHGKRWEWKNRIMALWKHGECWWKDNLGVEHLILIEKQKRMEKWGLKKEGIGEVKLLESGE